MSLAVATSPIAAAADLVGPGCADYAALNPSGPASVDGMSQDPVATAASNNPELTTLTSALSGQLNPQVNLVDTLNNGQYTVFAPTDAAFNKLPASTIDELKTNSDMLTKILTYHVVQGQLSPARVDGMQKTPAGRERDGDRPGQRPQGQQRQRGLRRSAHRERHGVHDRHRADAAGLRRRR